MSFLAQYTAWPQDKRLILLKPNPLHLHVSHVSVFFLLVSTVCQYLYWAVFDMMVRKMLFVYQNFREEASFTDVALNQMLRRSVTICKNNRNQTVKCHAELKLIISDSSWFTSETIVFHWFSTGTINVCFRSHKVCFFPHCCWYNELMLLHWFVGFTRFPPIYQFINKLA